MEAVGALLFCPRLPSQQPAALSFAPSLFLRMSRQVSAVVVCGPSGVGKTTVGRELAVLFKCRFEEGDDYHSEASKEKMRSGVPLTDEDRAPWLRRLQKEVLTPCQGRATVSVVLACSTLRCCYRVVLRGMDHCKNAKATADTLQRTDVFFPAAQWRREADRGAAADAPGTLHVYLSS